MAIERRMSRSMFLPGEEVVLRQVCLALVPTPEEAEIQERQRADQAEAQAAVLLRKLQELGIDPADL